MSLRFDITGVPRLDLKLQRMPRRVQQKVVKRAIEPSATEVLGAVKVAAPRRSGRLAAAQRKRAFNRRGRMGYRIGSGNGKSGGDGYANLADLGRRNVKGSAYLRGPFYSRRKEIVHRGRAALVAALRDERE